MHQDLAYFLMSSAVRLWLVSAAVLVWGWPCVVRGFAWAPRPGLFSLQLPRGVTTTAIVVDILALLFHLLVRNFEPETPVVLCLLGIAATLDMRSALRRQVSP